MSAMNALMQGSVHYGDAQSTGQKGHPSYRNSSWMGEDKLQPFQALSENPLRFAELGDQHAAMITAHSKNSNAVHTANWGL